MTVRRSPGQGVSGDVEGPDGLDLRERQRAIGAVRVPHQRPLAQAQEVLERPEHHVVIAIVDDDGRHPLRPDRSPTARSADRVDGGARRGRAALPRPSSIAVEPAVVRGSQAALDTYCCHWRWQDPGQRSERDDDVDPGRVEIVDDPPDRAAASPSARISLLRTTRARARCGSRRTSRCQRLIGGGAARSAG